MFKVFHAFTSPFWTRIKYGILEFLYRKLFHLGCVNLPKFLDALRWFLGKRCENFRFFIMLLENFFTIDKQRCLRDNSFISSLVISGSTLGLRILRNWRWTRSNLLVNILLLETAPSHRGTPISRMTDKYCIHLLQNLVLLTRVVQNSGSPSILVQVHNPYWQMTYWRLIYWHLTYFQ